MKPNGQLLKILVYWYGSIQILHFGALIRAAFIYWTQHLIVFPAPAPTEGWSEQAMFFLLALGLTDSLIIILSLIFVWGFYKKRPWFPILGLLSTSAINITALVFAISTIPTGAWYNHPLAYGVITLLFLPFPMLSIQLCRITTIRIR